MASRGRLARAMGFITKKDENLKKFHDINSSEHVESSKKFEQPAHNLENLKKYHDIISSIHAESSKDEPPSYNLPASERPDRSSSLRQTQHSSQELSIPEEYVPRALGQRLSDIDEVAGSDSHSVHTLTAEKCTDQIDYQNLVNALCADNPTGSNDQENPVKPPSAKKRKGKKKKQKKKPTEHTEGLTGPNDHENQVIASSSKEPAGQNDQRNQASVLSTGQDTVAKGQKKEIGWARERMMILSCFYNVLHYLDSLECHINLYLDFDGDLGDVVSGSRHLPFVNEVHWAVHGIQAHVIWLDACQQGGKCPELYRVAKVIAEGFNLVFGPLKIVLQEDVDMTNEVARWAWVQRKNVMVAQTMGGVLNTLRTLQKKKVNVGREEVKALKKSTTKRWEKCGQMPMWKLVKGGWVDKYDE